MKKMGVIMMSLAAGFVWLAQRPMKSHPDSPVRMRGIILMLNMAGRIYEAIFQRALFRLDPSRVEAELRAIKEEEAALYGTPHTPSEYKALSGYWAGLESPGALTSTIGRLHIQRTYRRSLEHRRQILTYVKKHPEVLNVPIRRPLIIASLPRTGTTFLQRLMATDPRSRSPHVWVMMTDPNPSPPTKEAIESKSDPRLEAYAGRKLTGALISPEKKRLYHMSHAMSATAVNEESQLMADCMWTNTGATYVGKDDAYVRWILNEDDEKRFMYRYVKVWLQLQTATYAPESHWLLKTPAHAFFLPTLVEEFPDANLVFIHRDPCQVVPSAGRLNKVASILTMDFYKYDARWHGQRVLNALSSAAERIRQFHNSDCENARQAIHIQYEDLVRNPIATVEKIYAHFGYEMTDAFRANMEAHLAENKQHKHGKPEYSLEEFDLTRADIEATFADYLATFRPQQVAVPVAS